jgi:hypothetical protein
MLWRRRIKLLRYDFSIVHHPGAILPEYVLLSRYNAWAEQYRATFMSTAVPVDTAFLQDKSYFTSDMLLTTVPPSPMEAYAYAATLYQSITGFDHFGGSVF